MAFVQDARGQRVERLIKVLNKPDSDYVMVVAHRGDWRNAPENSIRAIERVIEMGVDMVEIDIQRTRDGVLIVMHDGTVDRTTTGKGKVSDLTFNEISQLYLKNGAGIKTTFKIPTLEAALRTCKDKILVNIDKGYQYFEDAYAIIQKTGTERQVIIKGTASYNDLTASHADLLSRVIYMPVINLDRKGAAETISIFSGNFKPAAFELVFDKDTSAVLQQFHAIRRAGSRVWVNTLWASLCAGHEDDKATEYGDIDGSWNWVLKRGANMIQTDRPRELIAYLKRNKYRSGL